MKLIVGLGNPGKKYINTRHNVGYILVDMLATKNNLTWHTEDKFFGDIAKNDKQILLKPTTFMNDSGKSVSKVLAYFNVNLRDLYIIHDDADLEFGRIKKCFGCSSAGHHGVEDIFLKLGSKDFNRIRIGIGRPVNDKFNIHNFVLNKLSNVEMNILDTLTLNILE